jgi:D5 N terminal like
MSADFEALFDLSDDALAEAIGLFIANRFRYHPGARRWFIWAGERWREDSTLEHMSAVRDFLRNTGAELRAWADRQEDRRARNRAYHALRGLLSAQKIKSVVSLLRSDRTIVAGPEFDVFDDGCGKRTLKRNLARAAI